MKTRHVILILALFLLACGGPDEPGKPISDDSSAPDAAGSPDVPEPDPAFTGMITWKATAGGEDEEGAEMFRGLAATEVRIAFGGDHVRIEEIGGMNEGVMLLLPGEGDFRWKAIRLDSGEQTFERANWVNDLDAVEPEVKKMLPTTYATEIEPTGESAEVCGHEVEKVKVVKSAFVAPGAVCHLWLAKGLTLPAVRVQADFEACRMNSPLMLSFPGLPGAVLKAEVLENDVLVTWEATEIVEGAPAASLFEVPDGWTDAEQE